jgi:diadenosine tetraphosphatase ApaH/serine/threonine PP2A family protein phosphatase
VPVESDDDDGWLGLTRIAVLGGTYANPYALQAVLDDAREKGAERIFCLGDLGGFGAECDAIWPLLTDNGVEVMAGNYDIAIGRGDTDCGCGYSDPRDNEFAQITYDYTLANTSREFAAWMRELPLDIREEIGGLDVHMVHGSPLQTNDFFWESLDDEETRLRVKESGADVILCTHSGLPWIKRFEGTLLCNVGVVGRPANNGSRDVCYAIVDLADGHAEAEIAWVAYDWQAHAASMRAAGLPEPFVETIETGWWTTCLEVVPPRERPRGKYHLYRSTLPTGAASSEASWADPVEVVDDGLPVIPLFGSPFFPPRLWVYTNFHCNLRCWYCSVASSPKARKRSLGLERFTALVDEAVAEGFTEIYMTGGEPFLEPDIIEMAVYASDRLDVVLLTNGMLYKGQRLEGLQRLVGQERLVLQTSIDGARAATHDANRGEGSWERAMEGIRIAADLGLPVRVGMTETDDNRHEVPELRAMLADLGITGRDFAVRPLVKRGFSDDGLEIDDTSTIPELAVTDDGVHWHPAGADLETSPDMLLAAGEVPLAEAKRLVVERFLTLRRADGSLPAVYNCAV